MAGVLWRRRPATTSEHIGDGFYVTLHTIYIVYIYNMYNIICIPRVYIYSRSTNFTWPPATSVYALFSPSFHVINILYVTQYVHTHATVNDEKTTTPPPTTTTASLMTHILLLYVNDPHDKHNYIQSHELSYTQIKAQSQMVNFFI